MKVINLESTALHGRSQVLKSESLLEALTLQSKSGVWKNKRVCIP